MSDSDVLVREVAPAWSPMEGAALRRLGTYLLDTRFLKSEEDFGPVRHSALEIVSRCAPFEGADQVRTGLVVGYVQSGKTLSMASVASAAADNGCRIVIVLAGTKRNLLTQSAGRFKKDLRGDGKYTDAWMMLDSTESLESSTIRSRFRDCLDEWNNPHVPEEYKVPLFWTVMKHHAHLDALRDILRHHDLRGIPALIIDDEADQAGLNTTPEDDEASTTFSAIRGLRSCLPHHSYLQYTATPQAPLLISLADLLSPDFAEVLEPGNGYTGGQTFFADNSPYVRPIPQDELFPPGSPPDSPPASLMEALRFFFVGTALGFLEDSSVKRSMLIHPSRLTDDHGTFVSFVQHAKRGWQAILGSSDSDPDKSELVEDLRSAYLELTAGLETAPPFDEKFIQIVGLLLGRRSHAQEVNAQADDVDWSNASAHILVGGEKLNRGFTVENLSVTWMPRDAGGWNADTLQQRARFFGYKRSYLHLCRIYLHPDVYTAFHDYVDHEEDIRCQLQQHRGRPLNEWKRAFFMDSRSKPTRNNVLSDPYYRSSDAAWYQQRHPYGDPEGAKANTDLVEALTVNAGFSDHPMYPQHEVAEVPIRTVLENLVVDWRVHGHQDVVGFFAVRCWMRDALEQDESATCQIIRIKKGEARKRKPGRTGAIQLFEGRRSSGSAYPGDAALQHSETVTIQLHTLEVPGEPVPVPAIAVRVPEPLRTGAVLVQPGNAP